MFTTFGNVFTRGYQERIISSHDAMVANLKATGKESTPAFERDLEQALCEHEAALQRAS